MATSAPPESFAQALPPAYRERFDAAAMAVHARLAAERGAAPARMGRFATPGRPGTAVCVVARDRPGLLALISAAFVMTGLDVIDGEVFTRRAGRGAHEAVDVFWLRHADPRRREQPVADDDVRRAEAALVDLLEGRVSPQTAAAPPLAAPARGETVVRFVDGHDGGLATLEVETRDRSGLLLALTRALFESKVQIVLSEVRTLGDRVLDRFSLEEVDGSPIGAARRLEIQVAVLGALEPPAEAEAASRPRARQHQA
jgi:UTP:GlnB (protein PII) uridylyltransferase